MFRTFGLTYAFSEYKKNCVIQNSIIIWHCEGDEYIFHIYCLEKDINVSREYVNCNFMYATWCWVED